MRCPQCGHNTLMEDGYYDDDGEWVTTLRGCNNCGYVQCSNEEAVK